MDQPESPIKGCCTPSRAVGGERGKATETRPGRSDSSPEPRAEVYLPGSSFLMGDAFGEGYRADGEGPVHEVQIGPFGIDVTAVTVAEFARFVEETGYVTDAERFGSSAVFHLVVQAETEDIIGTYGMSWWLAIRGADWRHPCGPKSGIEGLQDHPVVHVSHGDALAYCAWAGRDLPTEAEWEYAARGGRAGQRFPWGDELEEGGRHHANVWQGSFPDSNSLDDGWLTTAPARHFPPNGFGLYQMVGNVWEWCADWFNANAYRQSPRHDPRGPSTGTGRVVRGGSYLCHQSYCSRYRVAARSFNTPNSSTGNLGFRTVSRLRMSVI